MQSHYYHIVPRRGEHIEYVEKAKPENRPEPDDDQLSLPSTLHSLSQLDSTPEKTPMSTELQKGWSGIKDDIKHKASEVKGKLIEKFGEEIQPEKDLDSEVKEHIKEINEEIKHMPHGEEEIVEGQGQAGQNKKGLSSGKLGEIKGKIGSQVQGLKESSKQFFEKAKGKLTEEFGEEIQPEKDLDSEVKEHIKEINDEIKHLPHGEEEIVEGQGQGQAKSSKKESFKESSKQFLEKAKGKLTEEFGEEIQPEKDLDSEVKEHVKEINEEIKHMPHGEEEVVEGQGHAGSDKKGSGGSGSQDFRDISQGIVDKALEKIGEMKGKSELGPHLEQEKPRVEAQKGSQALTKDTKEEILELAQQITDKIQELKTATQLPSQQKPQDSEPQQQSYSSPEGSHEHHQLSTESESFKPTKESHLLMEKVEEAFEEHVPLVEAVEEIDIGKQSQAQDRQPALEKIQQGAQKLSDKFSGKAEDLKNKLNAPKQERREETRQERSFEGQEQREPEIQRSEERVQSEQPGSEERQPVMEKFQQGLKEASNKLSEKAGEMKDKLSAPKEEGQGEFKEERVESRPQLQQKEGDIPSQPKEKPLDSIKGSIQEASDKITDKVQEVKDSNSQKKEQSSDDQQGLPEEKPKERQPLVDQILGRIHAVNDNFHQSVENVRNAFKIEERTDERQPLLDVVTGRITDVTSKISHGIESVKSKVRPSHEEGLKEKKSEPHGISGGFQSISNLISQNVENVKERFMSHKESQRDDGTKKFHKVDENEGFAPETVKEYQAEKRLEELGGHELISDNPFESIAIAPEKQSYLERLRGRFGKEKDEGEIPEDERIKDVGETVEQVKEEGQGLKQRLSQNLESLKGRFGLGKGKVEEEVSEKIEESKPLEKAKELLPEEKELPEVAEQGNRLKEAIDQNMESLEGKFRFMKQMNELSKEKNLEEQPSEPLQQESQSLKQRISGGLHSISDRIYHNVDSLKGRFRSGKEEGQKEEEIEVLDEPEEPVQEEEESYPIESEKLTLKQRVAGSLEGLKSRFTSGKGKNEEKESEPKEGEFHVVTEGTTETVSELKEEERVEALLSNNPFEPLETKDTNLVQPLEGTDIVGGELKELTADEKPGFKVEDSNENEENAESKSLFQKVKTGILSTFSHKNKENVE